MKMIIKRIKSLIRYFIDIFYSIYINSKISHNTYVHLMFNSNLNYDVVRFFNKTNKNNNHLFLCKFWYPSHKFPEGDNVYKINKYRFINLKKATKIFCHGLFDDEIVSILYKNKDLLEKSYWIIWGGDLYEAPDSEKDNYVRSQIKNKITLWDKKVAIQKYGEKSTFYSAMVPSVTNEDELISNVQPKKNDGKIYIQINNSAHKSTIDMLQILSKFKDENIIVRTIVSYGDIEYSEEIEKVGKNIFGEKFEILKDSLSREDYLNFLNQNDILIMFQNRQQGLGNVLSSLRLGKKVYIKGTLTPFEVLNERQVSVFDSDSIKDISFKEFIKNENGDRNKINVYNNFLNEEIIEHDWNNIFSN